MARKIKTTMTFETEVDDEFVDESFAEEDILEQYRQSALMDLAVSIEKDEVTITNEFVYA